MNQSKPILAPATKWLLHFRAQVQEMFFCFHKLDLGTKYVALIPIWPNSNWVNNVLIQPQIFVILFILWLKSLRLCHPIYVWFVQVPSNDGQKCTKLGLWTSLVGPLDDLAAAGCKFATTWHSWCAVNILATMGFLFGIQSNSELLIPGLRGRLLVQKKKKQHPSWSIPKRLAATFEFSSSKPFFFLFLIPPETDKQTDGKTKGG